MARVAITVDNVSPLIEIITWFTLITSILTVLVRGGVKVRMLRRTNLDDVFISLSLLFSIGQSVSVSIATANGLGQRLAHLSPLDLQPQLKAQYASEFLFILSACFAKLSLVAFLRHLTPVANDLRTGLFIGGATLLWAFTGIVTTAFQCSLPMPWDFLGSTCFNRTAWADYVAIGNILTDVALIILPVIIVLRLKIGSSKKALLILVFSLRVYTVAAMICQLVYINKITSTSDATFDVWPIAICAQVAQCLSIITACTFYMKPLLDSLQSGFLQVGDLRRQQLPGYGFDPELGSRQRGSKLYKSISSLGKRRAAQSEQPSESSKDIELQPHARDGSENHEPSHSATVWPEPHNWDTTSQSHILRTTTWTVGESVPATDLRSSTGT